MWDFFEHSVFQIFPQIQIFDPKNFKIEERFQPLLDLISLILMLKKKKI
jgi:hypothetical protein